MTTIHDLKDDELRIILKTLSVRQLIHCLEVCEKWNAIIYEILGSQKVLSLLCNDICHYTKQEMHWMCSTPSHIAIMSSIGDMIGINPIASAFCNKLQFSLFSDRFLTSFGQFCPNIESLNLKEFFVKHSDIANILTNFPRLECLTISSNEKFWANSILTYKTGLKHLSLFLTSKASLTAKDGTPISPDLSQIEELLINGSFDNSLSEEMICTLLQTIRSKIIKFHLRISNHLSEERVIDLIQSLIEDNKTDTNIRNLNINYFAFDAMLDMINNNLLSLEVLYLHFNTESELKVSLKKLKNLKQIYLEFHSTEHDFGLRADSESENSFQFHKLLLNIPSTVRKITLTDAVISLNVFKQIVKYLPLLEELDLNYVYMETNPDENFWLIISSFRNIRSLTLNQTNISDEGCEHLVKSGSLETLELMKYKGPNVNAQCAQQTLIRTHQILQSFAKLANANPHKWFTLRLDIDVFLVNQDIKRTVPRNVKLLNVGYKK